MKWLIISLIIILIGVGVAVLVYKQKQSQSNSTPDSNIVPQTVVKDVTPTKAAPHAKQIITITKDGFSPQILTVTAGTQIVWQNKSGVEVSINSDPHPTHTNYPPLNLGIIQNDKSKSLIFNKSGKYGYHNHFDATQTGTIIVQ